MDAVIVAVPHRYLKEVALSAINAGKHVFIEKPMGLNAAEGAEVVEAAARRGVVAMVGYCMRYSLSRMFIKSLLDRGAVGDVSFVAAGKGGGPLGGWLGGPYAEGGGQLLFLGSHLTDQVLWMTSDDAEAVSGTVRWTPGGTDETSAYTVRLKGGAVADVLRLPGVRRRLRLRGRVRDPRPHTGGLEGRRRDRGEPGDSRIRAPHRPAHPGRQS